VRLLAGTARHAEGAERRAGAALPAGRADVLGEVEEQVAAPPEPRLRHDDLVAQGEELGGVGLDARRVGPRAQPPRAPPRRGRTPARGRGGPRPRAPPRAPRGGRDPPRGGPASRAGSAAGKRRSRSTRWRMPPPSTTGRPRDACPNPAATPAVGAPISRTSAT